MIAARYDEPAKPSVDAMDHSGSFVDACGNSLDRICTNMANGEDAWNAGSKRACGASGLNESARV